VKLPHLARYTAERQRLAAQYQSLLAHLPDISLPIARPDRTHIVNQFTLRVNGNRDALRAFLAERGIASAIYYPVPLHRQECCRIFVCGNGGSASAASHFATDMVKGASFGRETRFRVMALTDSLPTITAYSNDISYECVFVEQLRNFAEPGDVLIAISGSGN